MSSPDSNSKSDPPENKRIYYRHFKTGDRAYLVTVDGHEKLKVEKGGMIRSLKQGEWIPDTEHRPLPKHSIGRIAYVADQQLCRALGVFEPKRKEWDSMRVEDRIEWCDSGPPSHPVRRGLFRAIMTELESLTDG